MRNTIILHNLSDEALRIHSYSYESDGQLTSTPSYVEKGSMTTIIACYAFYEICDNNNTVIYNHKPRNSKPVTLTVYKLEGGSYEVNIQEEDDNYSIEYVPTQLSQHEKNNSIPNTGDSTSFHNSKLKALIKKQKGP